MGFITPLQALAGSSVSVAMRPMAAQTPARKVTVPSPWPWAIAGAALGAMLCAVSVFPARWLSPWIGQITGQCVLMEDVHGSVWNGSAVLVLSGGPGSLDTSTLPGRWSWQLRPRWNAALLPTSSGSKWAPGLSVQLQRNCCQQAPTQLSWLPLQNTAQITHLDWQLPASTLSGLGTPWNTLGFDGLLRLSAPQLQWQNIGRENHLHGQIQLQADALSSRIATLRPLGSYRVTLSHQDKNSPGALQLELSTLEGALLLLGKGERIAGQWRFNGQAQATPGHETALLNVLNLIGNRNGPITLRVVRP